MKTQKFMGRNSLLKRLTAQIGGNEKTAKEILIKRGHMNKDGTLTDAGTKRDAMTAAERAKDRAMKRTKAADTPADFEYNPHTNYAKKRR
jgi:hypothetical protein